MTAQLAAEQRAETKARRAANHSLEAFSLHLAEEAARTVRQHLKVVNYYTEDAFSDEFRRVNLLINRLGDRRRTLMKTPSTRGKSCSTSSAPA